jgi:8-oxo-dGTP diphosphatase
LDKARLRVTDVQLVVGAVIVDSLAEPHRVLAARRTWSNALRGRWEFPGGKVEPGESAEAALIREVQEELDVTLMLGEELTPTGETWRLISDQLTLRLFWAEIFVGTPTTGESHDELRWLDAAGLTYVNWLDADRAALPAILDELSS